MNGGRILLTTDVVGGVWDFALVLATTLARGHGVEVTLLALGELSDAQRRAVAGSSVELLAEPLKLEWMQDAERDVRRTQRLVADVARQRRVDLVHANQFAAAAAPLEVPVVLSVHSDVLSWWCWTHGGAAPTAWDGYARLVRQALGAADAVVAVSRFLAEQVRDLYGCRRPIEVIHNGWPAAERPIPATATRPPITLVAGRIWDAAKNVALAGRAVKLGLPPGEVVLAGQQVHPESGAAAMVPDGLRPLGFLGRADLDGWLAKARVYLSTARYDPFGLLPLQAALQGCALLLSDIPSYREVWDGAAAFFRSDDVHDLRARWARLLEDTVACGELGERARARALERYSAAGMADGYRACYAAVLGQPAGRSLGRATITDAAVRA